MDTGPMLWLLLTQGVLEKLGLKQEGNFPAEMRDGTITQDKETGQALRLNITFSPLPNPIPNEIRHRVGNRILSQHCIRASDLSSTGIIIDTRMLKDIENVYPGMSVTATSYFCRDRGSLRAKHKETDRKD